MTFQKPPLLLSGLLLGLLGFGNLILPLNLFLSHFISRIGLTLWLYLTISLVFNLQNYQEDFKLAPIHSSFATYPMASMLVAAYLVRLSHTLSLLGQVIWWLALLLHLFLIASFTYRHIISVKSVFITPSWTVLFVGIAISALTNKVVGQPIIGVLSLGFGGIASFILYPLIFISLTKKELPIHLKPQIAIYSAPISLLLGGYLALFGQNAQTIIVVALLILSQILYLYVLIKLPDILKQTFLPSFSALTFPLVNTALSLSTSLIFLGINFLSFLVGFEILVASGIVTYVLVNYLKLLIALPKSSLSKKVITK